MLRVESVEALHWANKTMTLMKAQQLQACEGRLSLCPSEGLFQGCDDRAAQQLWDMSFYAAECIGVDGLHTLTEMEGMVLASAKEEAAYLSVHEHLLIERMIIFDGETMLMNVEEASAAEALIKRLWCTLERRGDDYVLHMPNKLRSLLLRVIDTDKHYKTRDRLFRFDATIHGLLYLAGFLHIDQPAAHFMAEVMRKTGPVARRMAMRYLSASFDYVLDNRKGMILVHPGLADPSIIFDQPDFDGSFNMELNEQLLVGGMNEILPEEEELFEKMTYALDGALRPEFTREEAATDLRMLAKQGVAYDTMREVLCSLLTTLPTRPMLDLLQSISLQTPQWGMLKSKRQN